MTITEKIRVLLVRNDNMSESELARRMGCSPQNINSKMKRKYFTVSDLERIAEVVGCGLEVNFVMNGEKI
jgi:DNA-binding CsgD family transcriptional regulator